MNDDKNFLDSRTLLAVALVAIVWFGWQSYLAKKYPNAQVQNQQTVSTQGTEAHSNAAESQAPATNPSSSDIAILDSSAGQEWTQDVRNSEARFQISNLGLGLKNIELEKYFKRDHSKYEFARQQKIGLFALGLVTAATGSFQPLTFDVQTIDQGWRGVAHVGNMVVTRTLVTNSKDYSIENSVTIENPSQEVLAGQQTLGLYLGEKKEEEKKSGFLMGSSEHQEFFVSHSAGKSERINVSSAKEKLDKSFADVNVLALGSQYFAAAVVDKSEVIPAAHLLADLGAQPLQALLTYSLAHTTAVPKIVFKTFAGPKAHDVLLSVDSELPEILDFGYFSFIGKILLSVLRNFNEVFHNWGLSIIFLTLVVRLLVLPVNISSYRSMKRMQKVQPMMASIRERYKDDPQAMQRETMSLMKKEKVNPLGGCLPMLLQMPIFFALFSVLGHSIEIYQAPFFGWISDLSLKDPYFILPVLVGIIFFVQQKITPTTMDPAQAKVMQFMPIMFAVMMVSLPSGLNLYTFVSTLFGVTQQRIFMRDRNKENQTQPVKA